SFPDLPTVEQWEVAGAKKGDALPTLVGYSIPLDKKTHKKRVSTLEHPLFVRGSFLRSSVMGFVYAVARSA
ncbi:MAG: hypothetical protein ACOC6S_03310, partial [Chloroflexota bacterium]